MDAILDYVIDSLRRYTAIRAWLAEILLIFAILMLAMLAAAVWDGVVVDGEALWFAWWQAYDNAGSFADDAVALAISLTAVIEGSFMFLAKNASPSPGKTAGKKVAPRCAPNWNPSFETSRNASNALKTETPGNLARPNRLDELGVRVRSSAAAAARACPSGLR